MEHTVQPKNPGRNRLLSSTVVKIRRVESTALLASEHGAVGGVRVWLPYACPSAWAIKREYTKTLDKLQMHRHGVGGRSINLLVVYGLKQRRMQLCDSLFEGEASKRASWKVLGKSLLCVQSAAK